MKSIHTEEAREALKSEIAILSTVKHENIVHLKGYAPDHSILVMEYAEGGNLWDVLHNTKVEYSIHHAFSWSHQTAKGVAYLHSLHLVHRDIKPPNLLLQDYCRKIKICDFGTACSARTHMSTNKGSTMWMAPEVFSSPEYTAKCDVYSWAITFWEMLSRQRPVTERDIPPFQILWFVAHHKRRPPLFNICPLFIQNLITKCWFHDADDRPSMFQVENIMQNIVRLFNPHRLDRILLPSHNIDRATESDIELTSPVQHSQIIRAFTQSSRSQYSPVISVTDETHFASSDQPLHYQLTHLVSRVSVNQFIASGQLYSENILASGYSVDQSFRPVQPDKKHDQSMQLYKKHCSQLTKYILMDIECKLLRYRRDELNEMDRSDIPLYERERLMIEEDCDSLSIYLSNLKKQVDHLKQRKRAQQALKDGWVFL